MNLQADSSMVQSSELRVVSKFRSRFAVDEESKIISLDNDANVVPLMLPDVGPGKCPTDLVGMCLPVVINDQSCSARTGILLALGEVKIPCSQNLRTDPYMARSA